MFLSPLDPTTFPGKRAWDNLILFEDGQFIAFFSSANPGPDNPWGLPLAIDVAVSQDGVRWEFIARDAVPLPGAHAGYGAHRVGDRFYYYPTCSGPDRPVHFKIFASQDLIHWTHLGDRCDVTPDPRYYRARWDEMLILEDRVDGRTVLFGYISTEVAPEVGAPSVGLLKSEDGVAWEVLPPPVIEWGALPHQHPELNFCVKFGDRYYVSLAMRFYLDSRGYSLFTFVGDSPYGPFRPDLERFRLAGTSQRCVTWLGHAIPHPDGPLVALWLSFAQEHDLPSDNFAVGPLKRLACEDGHLRLAYWEGNEAGKGDRLGFSTDDIAVLHPAESVTSERDRLTRGMDAIEASGSRDGILWGLPVSVDASEGFVWEGQMTVWEQTGHLAAHQHGATAGFYFESSPGTGVAMLADTSGTTRTGTLQYADHQLSAEDPFKHLGKGLVRGRAGELQGTLLFSVEDAFSVLGCAAFAGIRHGRQHAFRILARRPYFELYLDDCYVQTWTLPAPFTGRLGCVLIDGQARFEQIALWRMRG